MLVNHHIFPYCLALVTDLYMDRAGFKGQNVKDNVPKLLEHLDNCELQSLLEFFEVAPANAAGPSSAPS